MKLQHIIASASALAALMLASHTRAQVGQPYIHDPSTIAECDGKY